MSEIRISIEGITPELRSAYKAAGLSRAANDGALLDWTFTGQELPFAVARIDERVVGFSGYIRSRMKFGGRQGVGYQAVDSFVFEEARGGGLFTRLAKAYDVHVAEIGRDLIWGFPNDNAAPAWFEKLDWLSHEQVPFLIKPLRAGYFLRRFGLPGDFPLSFGSDQNLPEIDTLGAWVESIWENAAKYIYCGTIRDTQYLTHRILKAPQRVDYRIVADSDPLRGSIVITREAEKHGGRIAYLMEALGGDHLAELIHSECARLRERGVELVLAWAFPWSPNYSVLRRCGFLPLPQKLRPINIWFGSRAHSVVGMAADNRKNWFISYLDSDTI